MNKKILKIGFADDFGHMFAFIMETLSKEYNVIHDNQNPEYLFFSDIMYGERNLIYKNCIKIFFTIENFRPWDYKCEYAITFDHLSGKKFYRLPFYVIDNWYNKKYLNLPDFKDRPVRQNIPENFCSFVVTRDNSSERKEIFFKLSEYKKVNSGGKLFNNIGYELERHHSIKGEGRLQKFESLRQHKFNICYENSSYPGYVTEKLFHALYTNVIPIYWGSPCVEMDFNPESFINRLDFNSDESMIDYIIKIDNDDELYKSIINKSPINQRNKCFDLDLFLKWFRDNVYYVR